MPMNRLELATQRLATSLEKLEKAADSANQARPAAGEAATRLAALESERQTLLTRIAALEEELTALSGITEEVEGRLDGAIGDIRAALARS
jgi:predicted  nucleic acid-binding Zn-ribbon protein